MGKQCSPLPVATFFKRLYHLRFFLLGIPRGAAAAKVFQGPAAGNTLCRPAVSRAVPISVRAI